jgi:hypothetical protein
MTKVYYDPDALIHTPTQIAPATHEPQPIGYITNVASVQKSQIRQAILKENIIFGEYAGEEPFYSKATIDELLARIRQEQAARKQAEEDADLFHDEMERWKALAKTVPETCASIREQTIRECAELARLATENDGYAFSNYVKNVVLGVIPPKKAPERKP